MSFMGVDIGTTGCKAAVYDEKGGCLGSAYREYEATRPKPDWIEYDSQTIFDKVKEVIAEAAAGSGDDPVAGIGFSSMGEAMVPVTRDRHILGPCVPSSDLRGEEYVERLRGEINQEDFYAINPNILGVNYSFPKLAWTRDHCPEIYEKADLFLLWADLVPFMLGGEPVANHSLANRTLLFDIQTEDWSDELLKMTNIDADKLPETVPAGTVLGHVSPTAATELGLPTSGVKLVAGGHDQCCNSLGAGGFEAGKAVCGIGTFECVTPSFDFIPDTESMLAKGLNVEHHVLPGLYVSFIYNQAGSLIKWFRDTFAVADKKLLSDDQDVYEALGREMPEDPTGLITLPCFEMTGPPDFIANGSGVIVGLKVSTQRGEIMKSLMESVTLYFVESIKGLTGMGVDASEFMATGGGAKSDQWLQLKADIFGVPFTRPVITECSVLGAAMLAGIASGVFASPADAVAALVNRDRVFEPDQRRHEIYQRKHETFQTLFSLMKTRFDASGGTF